GGSSRTFPIQSSTTCVIPAVAKAYSFNITVVPPGPLGFITAYPTGESLPLAATVNSPQGFIVGNAAVVPAGTNGMIDIFASDRTEVVIDINGYYAGGALVDNTVLGVFAFGANTSGTGNTAMGNSALANNTTGKDNTGIGELALAYNATGNNN